MNEVDKIEIENLKKQIIDSCQKCGGYDLQCVCYRKFWAAAQKIVAGIPAKYRKLTFDDLNDPNVQAPKKKVLAYLKELEDNFNNGLGLYIYGENGTGKTALASCAVMAAIDKGYSGLSTNLNILTNLFVRENLRDVFETDFLIIDDLGKEMRTQKSSDLLGTALDTVLRTRTNALLPTFITSNYDYEDLLDFFGDFGRSIVSLLHEHMKIIQCNSRKDYRKQISFKRKKKK